jgi:DNA repair protein RadC
MKKPTIQVRRNGATSAAPVQAKTKTPAVPGEFKIVRMRDCPVDSPKIDTPPEVVDFWRKHVVSAPWFKDDKECLCVFLLNTRRRLIGFELVSQGTLDTILMHPREVLRPAAIHNAAAIIIAHNHPSGDPSPSEGDIAATRQLIHAAEHLKIGFLDSIIIGDVRRKKSFTSLRGLGYFTDDTPAPVSASASAELRRAAGEVEGAKNNVFALLHLMSDSIDCRVKVGEWTEEFADKMSAGISQLVQTNADFLDDSVTGLFHALRDENWSQV